MEQSACPCGQHSVMVREIVERLEATLRKHPYHGCVEVRWDRHGDRVESRVYDVQRREARD